MCGIAGIGPNANGDEAKARCSEMLWLMRHRGPDHTALVEYEGGTFGMTRLALVDLSDAGNQPFWSADRKVALIMNGEVYNFREERARLEVAGHQFSSTTDTEVVLACYLADGVEFVRRLRGMFAIAIFDWRHSDAGHPAVLLARDQFGIKPLYVRDGGPSEPLAFASEVRPLAWASVVPSTLDEEAVAQFLRFGFVVEPRTMLSGVRMLLPGTLEIHRPGLPIRRSRFGGTPPFAPRRESLEDAAARLRDVVVESARLHALADAEVGAFLSGGIDSSILASLMRHHVPVLKTFSVGYEGDSGEASQAADFAKRLDCEHHVFNIRDVEIPDLFTQFVEAIDQPSIDGFNTWLVARSAAHEVKGVISGLGADEMFAGYPSSQRLVRREGAPGHRAVALAARLAGTVRTTHPRQFAHRLDAFGARRSRFSTWLQSHTVLEAKVVEELTGFDDDALSAAITSLMDSLEPAWTEEPIVEFASLLDKRVFMGQQLLRDSDSTTMSRSVELRVPFVDREVEAFSRSCASAYKLAEAPSGDSRYGASGAKRVLIDAFRDDLPAGILERPKRGFHLPFQRWLDGCLHEQVAALGADWFPRGKAEIDQTYPRGWAQLVLDRWQQALMTPH